jgi:hypothetical protein
VSDAPEYETPLPVTESRKGFSVHVTFDVMGVESKQEAQARVMDNLPKLPGVSVSQVHIGRYEITAPSGKYRDAL